MRLPRSMWRLVIANQPTSAETYTPHGERIFAAYQAIEKQVDGSGPGAS